MVAKVGLLRAILELSDSLMHLLEKCSCGVVDVKWGGRHGSTAAQTYRQWWFGAPRLWKVGKMLELKWSLLIFSNCDRAPTVMLKADKWKCDSVGQTYHE